LDEYPPSWATQRIITDRKLSGGAFDTAFPTNSPFARKPHAEAAPVLLKSLFQTLKHIEITNPQFITETLGSQSKKPKIAVIFLES
jgi:hypothetical protein